MFFVDDGDGDDTFTYIHIIQTYTYIHIHTHTYTYIHIHTVVHPGIQEKLFFVPIDLGFLFGSKIVALFFVSNDHYFPMHAFKKQL